MTEILKAFDMPSDQEARWEEAFGNSDELGDAGNTDAAIAAGLQAWELIPEPKMNCSVAHMTLLLVFKHYMSAKRYSSAAELADRAVRESPFKQATVPIFAVKKGVALFESGDMSAARAAFDIAWSINKDFGFKGEDAKYLKFYLSK